MISLTEFHCHPSSYRINCILLRRFALHLLSVSARDFLHTSPDSVGGGVTTVWEWKILPKIFFLDDDFSQAIGETPLTVCASTEYIWVLPEASKDNPMDNLLASFHLLTRSLLMSGMSAWAKPLVLLPVHHSCFASLCDVRPCTRKEDRGVVCDWSARSRSTVQALCFCLIFNWSFPNEQKMSDEKKFDVDQFVLWGQH